MNASVSCISCRVNADKASSISYLRSDARATRSSTSRSAALAIASVSSTVRDVLQQLTLRDYLLSKGPNEPFLANADSLYDKVNDGEKVFASTKAEVGVVAWR